MRRVIATVRRDKKPIQASQDITNGWWTKYYNSIPLEEATDDPEEFVEFMQDSANNYGYTYRGELEAKDEYINDLDALWSVSWFTDKNGDIKLGQLVKGRLYPVTEEDVLEYIGE